MSDPSRTDPNTEAADPTRAKDLTEMLDPNNPNFSTLSSPLTRANDVTEITEPRRAKCRIDMALPRPTLSSKDKADPNLATPDMLSVDPSLHRFLRLMAEPHVMKSSTEIELPSVPTP